MSASSVCIRDLEVRTSAKVGAGVLVGAVLLALSAPLRRCACDEDGGSGQSSSSVRQHVVMLHNITI